MKVKMSPRKARLVQNMMMRTSRKRNAQAEISTKTGVVVKKKIHGL